MGTIKKTYSQEFKYEVVKMYLEEGETSYQLSKNLNLDAKMIRRWVHAFREHGVAALAEQRGRKTGSGKGGRKTKGLSLEAEIERLRMENAFLKKLREIQRR
jgi:transposase